MGDLAKDEIRDEMRRKVFKENVPGFATQRGLEIGALCSPLFTKEEANIKYYDIFPQPSHRKRKS